MKRKNIDMLENIIEESPATNKLNLQNNKKQSKGKKNKIDLVQKAILVNQENHDFLDKLMWKYKIRSESRMIRILLTAAETKAKEMEPVIDSLIGEIK